MNVLFIHYEIEPDALQAHVPFPLDVRDGKAYVSLVAFAQQKLRLAWGGPVTAWAGAIIGNHRFLNVRTYVPGGGIYFIAEWVPRRLATWVAPPLYGLPYRLGRLGEGSVRDATGQFTYEVPAMPTDFATCAPGSRDEFLLERYVAYTERCGVRRRFRVAHAPWPQQRVPVTISDDSLLRKSFAWWPAAKLVGANYSPGMPVTIGKVERCSQLRSLTRRWR